MRRCTENGATDSYLCMTPTVPVLEKFLANSPPAKEGCPKGGVVAYFPGTSGTGGTGRAATQGRPYGWATDGSWRFDYNIVRCDPHFAILL